MKFWKMKSFCYLILVFIILASLNCKKREEGRYYNNAKHFSIKVPPSWDIEEKKLQTDMIAVSPAEGFEDNFRENFNVLVENLTSKMTADEYYQKGIPLFKQFATEFAHHANGSETIDGIVFRYDIISHKIGPLKIKVIQYLTVYKGKGYLITFSASFDKYQQYEPLFKEIAKSFRFE
ncbi:MAG: hypothetical protein N2316_08985 [Spirochaetes bacterium]|nr:hypothetical protein [Spirochaetota bacterium]